MMYITASSERYAKLLRALVPHSMTTFASVASWPVPCHGVALRYSGTSVVLKMVYLWVAGDTSTSLRFSVVSSSI